jgi:long-subunit fatty acid transport protein
VPKEQSLIRDFQNQAEGLFPDELSDFGTGLAYDVFLIDNPDSLNPTDYIENGGNGDIDQVQTAERDGRLSETAISVGTNYKDILFLGLSLGFQSLVYQQEVETRESPESMTDTDLRNYNFSEKLEISGLGLNFKLGAMVKAGKFLRFGGSVQTPTTFSLTDEFRNSISASYLNPVETLESESQLGTFEYRVKTPWRYMVSAAGLLGNKGLLSIQYEYTDFSNGELKDARDGNDANFSTANDIVNDQFSASNILRAGAEYRFTSKFYGRAGAAYFSNPITGNEGFGADLDRMQYAGGFGYRDATWNIDLSYQWAQFEEVYKTNNSANVAVLENQLQSIVLTAGLRL